MTGSLDIVGLGPGAEDMVTPEVRAALDQATDVVGYIPYVARVAARDGLTLHPSDNRVELDRARQALEMALQGQKVVVVSSGDPGVFAMASAVFEALEDWPEAQALHIRVLPGITAMLAAAAALGMLDMDPTTTPTGAKPQACVTTTRPVRIFKNILPLICETALLLQRSPSTLFFMCGGG